MTLIQTKTASAVNLTTSFAASGGTAPYTYSVLSGGAGGSIGSSTGIYTAPAVVNGGLYGPPKQIFDTVQVVDSSAQKLYATAQIMIGNTLQLFCDIIQTSLSLANGRVYLWDQKINEPDDSGLFVAVSQLSCKPFSNVNAPDGSGGGVNSGQSVNMYSVLQVDVISRDTEARDRKEEVLIALNSTYAQQQQEANSFYIGKLPPGSQFVNLSSQDGAAIPYRFNISVAIQYVFVKTVAVPYFTTFATPQVNTNP